MTGKELTIESFKKHGNYYILNLLDIGFVILTQEDLISQYKFQMAFITQLGWLPQYIENNKNNKKNGYKWAQFINELLSFV